MALPHRFFGMQMETGCAGTALSSCPYSKFCPTAAARSGGSEDQGTKKGILLLAFVGLHFGDLLWVFLGEVCSFAVFCSPVVPAGVWGSSQSWGHPSVGIQNASNSQSIGAVNQSLKLNTRFELKALEKASKLRC